MQWMMTCPEKISLTWKTQKLWKSKHRSTRVKTSIKHSEYIIDIHIIIIFVIYNGFSSSYINIQEWFTLIFFFRKGVAFIYFGKGLVLRQIRSRLHWNDVNFRKLNWKKQNWPRWNVNISFGPSFGPLFLYVVSPTDW